METGNVVPEQPTIVHSEKNGMATAGFVLGVAGFLLSWIPLFGIWFGWILGILAIIFGSIGISKSGRIHVGKALAIAALVFGIITVISKAIPGFNLL